MPERFAACLILAQAMGIEAFAAEIGLSVAVRFRGQNAEVAVGDRTARWRVSSNAVRFQFQYLFAVEPGMWRWVFGLGPDDVLLDVGANVGVYTVAAAALGAARVVAVEPFEPNVEALRANIALNEIAERVSVLPFAASAHDGEGTLLFGPEVPGAANQQFIPEGDDIGADAQANGGRSRIRGASIDELIARGAIPVPSHVKIDVDGSEDGVIAGMADLLSNPRLRQIRLEIRWWWPQKRPIVAQICRHGFRARVDDDYKNLMFTRTDGPIDTEIAMPPAGHERFAVG